MPWPSAPIVTAASPVSTPARARKLGCADLVAERRHGGDQVERCPHSTLGVVLGRGRRAPDGHHRVADELLDRAAVELDQPTAGVEVAGEELAHLLRIAALRERREADEVGEEDGDEPALGCGRGGERRQVVPPRRLSVAPHSPQNFSPGSFAAPHDGQPLASAVPHSEQNFRPSRFSVPQLGQVTPAPRRAGRTRSRRAARATASPSGSRRSRAPRRATPRRRSARRARAA